jgi:hypothetical protein
MHYTTILHHACVHDVLIGVQLLVTAAIAAMHENPLRHQHGTLHVAEMTMEKRPIYVRNSDRRLIGVFRELPREGLPCGDRLLVVGVPYQADCPSAAAGHPGDSTEHAGCCGRCRGTIPMEVRVDPRFPLDEIETRWKLGQIFKIDELTIVNTHPSWLTQDRGETLVELRPLPDVNRQTPQAAGQCPRAFSETCPEEEHCKRPSKSTQKLEPLVAALPDMRRCQHLMPQWLAWYSEEHGREPSDIKGSFRHAVETCVRRIERRRAGAEGRTRQEF